MDRGKGVAAVVLLWPVRDQWPPEIDFAEDGGRTNTRHDVSATLHYGADDRQIQRTVRADFTRWHTVGVEWTPGKLSYTLDGRRWAVVRHPRVPAEAMELAIQSQAGTCGDLYAPCPDSTTPARVNVQIDWVAGTQTDELPPRNAVSPHAACEKCRTLQTKSKNRCRTLERVAPTKGWSH
jgi:beta-glucanase (GH16 family)